MTIEERAKEHFAHSWHGSVIDAYIEGANDQIDLLRNALIERQGEYISLELIKEIFEDYGND